MNVNEMSSNANFEEKTFNFFEVASILTDDNIDLDNSFFNNKIKTFNSPFFYTKKLYLIQKFVK